MPLKTAYYKQELEDTQAAILNVLDDYKKDSENILNSRKAVLNILEDLELSNSKLEYEKAMKEATLSSIGDGLVVVDIEGKITYVNKGFENILGWSSAEILGKKLIDVIPSENEKGETITAEDRLFAQILSGKISTLDTTNNIYYLRKDKTRFPVSSIVKPILIDGKMIGVVKTFRDVTKEKEIDKAKTELVSLASHQLLTPLSIVSWYSEMLLAGDAGDLNEMQKKYLGAVYAGNQRMIDLVNSLLNVSKMELGTFVIKPELTSMAELILAVVNEENLQMNSKGIKFSLELEQGIPNISIDPKYMRMVVQNLLSNALKYTSIAGAIKLKLSQNKEREKLIIEVSDTGIGIPSSEQGKIFTKHFRAQNVLEKDDTQGTGLGLYLAKSIVDHSGGKIWFESEVQVGTNFFVELPL